MIGRMYQAQRVARSEFVPIRHLNYHVRLWGQPRAGQAPLVLVHGWMDVSASWQFMVDALAQDRWVIAPDWRGYGLTGRASGVAGAPDGSLSGSPTGYVPAVDSYWFPDYLADLDFLLDHYAPDAPVDLVGHSMGGNIVMMYAGSRPERIRRLVNLEGFGMARTKPAQAPGRYARWMDELKSLHRGESALKSYDSAAGVAARLRKTNPRLTQDKADWLAQHWARPDAQGRWHILGDPAHKIINANLYQVDEALALYERIERPVLAVVASENRLDTWWDGQYSLAEFRERLSHLPDVRIETVDEAGHMLHHDQPAELARRVESFLTPAAPAHAAEATPSPGAAAL
jgi:pimeloyl-ACP methyl ester carboxylesterase